MTDSYFYMEEKGHAGSKLYIVYEKYDNHGFFPGKFKAIYNGMFKHFMKRDYPGIKKFGEKNHG